jgi:hypothetical protein
MNLWNDPDCAAWHAALERYPTTLRALPAGGLDDLDRWVSHDLPGLIAGRTPPSLMLDELERVTSWKMKRGVWRARNRVLVAGNDPGLVATTSVEAFAAVPDPRRPIAILSRLAGVGPATASAVLAAFAPVMYPFFDEMVAAQIPGLGPVDFTAPYYARYAAALRERAAALNEGCTHQPWTAHDLAQALWAVAP